MVKDLELMMDIKPLYEKKIIIWGMGAFGKAYFFRFLQVGVKAENIILCDLNPLKCGDCYEKHKIMTPDKLKEVVTNDNYIIFIASVFTNTQAGILCMIDDLGLGDIDVYTEYGVKWSLYLNNKNTKKIWPYLQAQCNDKVQVENTYVELQRLKFLTFAPLYTEMILVYQPGKVGSMSIHESILAAGKYALHVHNLRDIQYSSGNIKKMAQMHDTKIISLVRDPVSRAMSLLWYGLRREEPYHSAIESGECKNFIDIQQKYFSEGFENKEFRWFDKEMKEVFGIDIYEYPFDKEEGYSIIQQGNIQLMLLTTEKINDLVEIIGTFLGIDHFKLESTNVGSQSDYRFAYEAYKEKVYFKKSMLDRVYYNNPYMQHFYTEKMIDDFYHRWKMCADDTCPNWEVMIAQ